MKKKALWQLCFQLTCFTLTQECVSLPKDHQVARGSAEVKHVDPFTMEIHPSDQAIINYSAFDISRHEKVRFIQNSNSSCVLNRVVGNDPSQIFGSLESNGKVFLVNPNGIYFGADSTVNVGSFIASTLDLADEDFLAENYRFSLTKNSEIRNEGFLSSIEGSIVLMAPKVCNLGSIEAKAGTVLLASGKHVTLDFVGDGLVRFAVEGSLKEALIEHLGHIKGSIVSLKLPTAKQAIQEIVNLEGMQEGDVFTEENGIIKFVAGSTLLAQKTHLEASQLSIEGSIKGNEVHLLGKDIILQGAEIDVSSPQGGGEVLIGGEYQGKGTTPYAQNVKVDETSRILANALENGDGGLVVLWSKDRTVFDGKIEAHGGPLGGNGGIIETSSVGGLGISTGRVEASAPKGKMGGWLLDPLDVYILPSPATTTCTESSNVWGNCVNGNDICYILNNALTSASASITVQATNIVKLSVGTNLYMGGDNVGITLGGCPTSTVIVGGNIKTKSGAVNLIGNVVQMDIVTIDTTQSLSSAPTVSSDGADIYCLNLERSGSGVGLGMININAGTAGTVTIGTLGSYAAQVTVSNAKQIKTPGIVLENIGPLSLTAVDGILATASTTTLSAIGAININTTIDAQDSGDYNLTIFTGGSFGENVNITQAIGGKSPLVNVQIRSVGTASLNSITTKSTGFIDISPPAIINQSSVITSNGGPITFANTISDSTVGSDTLEIIAGTGLVTLVGNIGALASFTIISASEVDLGGSITAYDSVSITPDLTLTGSSAIQIQATSGDVSLAAVTSSTTQNFTCISSGDTTVGALTSLGDVNISADTISLSGAITATSLTLVNTGTLTVNAGTINLSGGEFNQSGGGSVTLATNTINTDGGDVTFAGALNPFIAGSSNLTIVAGAGLVTLDGQVGTVGTAFGSVTVTSGSEVDLVGSIYAIDAVSIIPSVVLTGASTIQATSGTVSLPGVSSSNSSSFIGYAASTITVGALSGLGNINLTGTAVTLGGSVTSSTSLTITDSISLSITSGDITLAGSFVESGGGSVTLGNTITAGGGISFADQVSLISNQTVYLTASGSPGIVLSGDVIGSGGGYNLVLTSYAGVNAQNLGTDGNPLGIVSLVSDVNSSFTGIAVVGIVEVFAPIVLKADPLTLVQTVGPGSSGYYFTFSDTIDSSPSTHYALKITAAATPISLQGALGSMTPLGAVTVSGTAGLSLGSSIDTYGGIVTLNPSVVLTGASTIDTTFASASGANIVFGSTVDGDQSLTLKAGSSGSITFSSDVGATPLSSLDVVSASLINIKNITVKGEINIPAPIIVSDASTAITSTANGEIILGNIDGTTSGAQSLTVITTGDVTLGLVGTTSLQNLTVTSSYVTIRSITATGTVDLEAKTILAESTTLTGGTIVLGMLNGSTTGNQNLTLTGGAITLSGGVGTLVPLASVVISGSSLDLGSSIYTYAQPVTISAPVTLSADVTIDATDAPNAPLGADITIGSTVDGAKNFIVIGGTSGVITLSEDIGATTSLTSLLIDSASSVKTKNVTTTGSITINPSITLSDALTTFTSNSGGSVALGSIDGTSLGSQSLTVSTVGAVSLGAIGNSVPLVNVTDLTGTKATIQNILVSGNIIIDIPIVLASSATLNTTENGSTGSNMTFQTINGTTIGGESLTVVAGSTGTVVFEGNIGDSSIGNPIGSLDVTGTSITFEGSTVVTKGTEAYHAPVLITQDITFTSLGNITFDSTVSPVSGTPSMTFSPGSGALTFTGSVASFNNIVVRNPGSFSSQAITANNLFVGGGLASIFINGVVTLGTPGVLVLDGGPIYLGAELDAKLVFMHSVGNISNIGLPQPINVLTSSLSNFEVFNAIKGVVGSIDSPIEINTPYTIVVGASPRADFIGTPNHTGVREISFNPPCIVTFNGATIVTCNPNASINRFPFLPKYLFYVPGLYSSWDNLSNREYFEEEPWALGSNPRDRKLMYLSPAILSKEEKVHRAIQEKKPQVSSGQSKVAPKKVPLPKQEPQPIAPQEEKKVAIPQAAGPQPVAPEAVKSPKVTVNVEIVTPEPLKQDLEQKTEKPSVSGVETPSSSSIPTNVKQKEQPVDWEFSIDFGKEPRPLDVLPD
jgi:filamentous hemagglutinin family protein